jgi:hypothetical protein
MARSLVLVWPCNALLVGATPIRPGYPRQFTPQEMRAWADDLARLYQTVEADRALPPGQRRLAVWLGAPRDQLTPEAQRVVEVHEKLLSEAGRGISGSLLDDGRVGLATGRHRAHYALERGSGPVPVWVSCADDARLQAFRATCHAAVERSRPDLTDLVKPDRGQLRAHALGRTALTADDHPQRSPETARELGRIAVNDAAREPDRTPERHLTREFGERTREGGRFLQERDR